jgi:hypothetical protein
MWGFLIPCLRRFSFNIDADTKQGFFASNRAGGKGSDDILPTK